MVRYLGREFKFYDFCRLQLVWTNEGRSLIAAVCFDIIDTYSTTVFSDVKFNIQIKMNWRIMTLSVNTEYLVEY